MKVGSKKGSPATICQGTQFPAWAKFAVKGLPFIHYVVAACSGVKIAVK
jgi:hypothetical protein